MYPKWFLFLFLFITSSAFATFRYELGTGFAQTDYLEKHTLDSAKDIKITQKALLYHGALRSDIWGNWLSIHGNLDYHFPTIETSVLDHEFRRLDGDVSLFIDLPAKPFDLIFSAESFYHDLGSSVDSVGYDEITGNRFSFILNLESSNRAWRFEARYPISNSVANRDEWFVDIMYNLVPASTNEGHYLLTSGQYLKLGYHSSKMKFSEGGSDPYNIELTTITFHWVGSW